MPRKRSQRKEYKRADRPEQKEERRFMILRGAAEEFARVTSAEDFTVNAVARRVGLAKGTVYLYYKTKNAILLELLGDAFENLLIDIAAKLAKLPEPASAQQVARTIRDCFNKSASTRRLTQLLKGVSDKEARASYQNYVKRIEPFMNRVDAIIVQRLPGLSSGDGRKLIRYGRALLVGLSDMAEHYPKLRGVPLNVEQSLQDALTLIIEGCLARPR